MSNAECNAVYGIVSDGAFCVDTSGGRGSCNVSCDKQIQRKLAFHKMVIKQQLVLICERKIIQHLQSMKSLYFLTERNQEIYLKIISSGRFWGSSHHENVEKKSWRSMERGEVLTITFICEHRVKDMYQLFIEISRLVLCPLGRQQAVKLGCLQPSQGFFYIDYQLLGTKICSMFDMLACLQQGC